MRGDRGTGNGHVAQMQAFMTEKESLIYGRNTVWNVHHIRPTKNQNSPNGRPVVMYKLPMIYGTRSYLQSVDEDKIEVCRDECVFRDEHPCDRDKNRWTSPTNIDDAMQLYCDIRNMLLVDLRR
ncbi:hypothetical protein ACJMK2_000341 [Sinanodonta woodiana]|uniref:Uncharacterized protein n=1 Tax=Sinanodonta woodiana TaxID=1069815 RepID=A0ABD3XQW0_SINWO